MAIQYLPLALQLGEYAYRSYSDQLRVSAHSRSTDMEIEAFRSSVELEEIRQEGRTARAAIAARLTAEIEPIRQKALTERTRIHAHLSALRIQHENDIQNKLIALETERTERHYALCTHIIEASERVYESKLQAFTESFRTTHSVLAEELKATREEIKHLERIRYDSTQTTDVKRQAISETRELREYLAQLKANIEQNKLQFDNQVKELRLDINIPEPLPIRHLGYQQ